MRIPEGSAANNAASRRAAYHTTHDLEGRSSRTDPRPVSNGTGREDRRARERSVTLNTYATVDKALPCRHVHGSTGRIRATGDLLRHILTRGGRRPLRLLSGKQKPRASGLVRWAVLGSNSDPQLVERCLQLSYPLGGESYSRRQASRRLARPRGRSCGEVPTAVDMPRAPPSRIAVGGDAAAGRDGDSALPPAGTHTSTAAGTCRRISARQRPGSRDRHRRGSIGSGDWSRSSERRSAVLWPGSAKTVSARAGAAAPAVV